MCFTCLYTYSWSLFLFAHFVYLHGSYKQSCNCVLHAAVSCGPSPDAPANGRQINSGTTFGSTVTYTCNPGYTLQGDSRLTCMANGEWSGKTPTCNCKLHTVLFLLLHGHQKSSYSAIVLSACSQLWHINITIMVVFMCTQIHVCTMPVVSMMHVYVYCKCICV